MRCSIRGPYQNTLAREVVPTLCDYLGDPLHLLTGKRDRSGRPFLASQTSRLGYVIDLQLEQI